MSLAFNPFRHNCATALVLTGLLALALAICGCGKKKSPEAAKSSADTQVTSPTQPAPGAAGPGPGPQVLKQPATIVQPDGQADIKELNRCLIRWLIANKRRPKDFADFAATAGVPIPPPPAGKQYVIGKNMHIVLVDR
jgi:murein DD-endopeptidase MepM/ murein hydrolase activator NlpD